jgi:LacI family transcriptional regulator
MPEHRVTMADIAREAGVHVTTVSMALRNHPRLPLNTRQRLCALAERMGYRPDPAMRALVAYRQTIRPPHSQMTLAYVTNWNTCWGWKEVTAHPQFYAGAEAKARELGFHLDHFWAKEPGMTHDRLSRILHARGIDGLIIASYGREMGDALLFRWEYFSAVKIDYFPHIPRVHNVTNDQCSMIRTAMRQATAGSASSCIGGGTTPSTTSGPPVTCASSRTCPCGSASRPTSFPSRTRSSGGSMKTKPRWRSSCRPSRSGSTGTGPRW